MADWLDVWSILGKEQGLELDMLEPVRMTVGGVKDPQKLSNLIPVMWVSSGLMDQGELEIHKQFFLGNLFKDPLTFYPSDYLSNKGLQNTLGYLAQIVRDGKKGEAESIAKQVLALFTAASMHEYGNGWRREFRCESSEAETKIEDWLDKNCPFNFRWHLRSTTLGPDTAFLEYQDFEEVLGAESPATTRDFCKIIIAGHRRVLDQYQLVIPTFQYEFRRELESDLLDWWEDLQAREEKAAVQRQAIRDARAAKEQLHHERLEQKRRALLSPERRKQEFPPLSWQNTTNERLQELLFEAPMTELAVRFSVSEAAIRKRVKNAGLSIPKRGHWLKKD
jgi:hypothetical protein